MNLFGLELFALGTFFWIGIVLVAALFAGGIFLILRNLVGLLNFLARTFLILVYNRKVIGLENVPQEGGALFVCNHVSYLDSMMVFCALPKPVRFFAHESYIKGKLLNYLANRLRTIRVLPGLKVASSLKEAREGLKNGDFVCVFPEGGITRTGQIKAFEPGFLSILKADSSVPIIPVYIGGLFGSMFSYAHGTKLKFWPRGLEERPIVAFGKPIFNPRDAMQVKLVVEELGVDSMVDMDKRVILPPRRLIRTAQARGSRRLLVDSLGIELSGKKFLATILALRRVLRRNVLAPQEKNVGLLVPMSVGGALTNAAITIDRRTSVNLNYTFGSDILNLCISRAEIKNVLTSRRMIERFPDLKLKANVFCMEDLREKVTVLDKMIAGFCAYLLPAKLIEWTLGLGSVKKEDPLTIVFTSGSTGTPKGAVLTHQNIAAVSRSFFKTTRIGPKDVMLGILPFFHAFGYVGNFWMVFLSGCQGVFHYNPLEPKKVGELARKYACTVMPSTPTFLRGFLKRCQREDFANLWSVLTGAEKLPLDLIEAWQKKFGPRPTEGYGATELSPCPCVNLPDTRIVDFFQPQRRDGSVGRVLPCITMKVVDLETGEDLPPNTQGMLLCKGPIVMKGYYKDPEKTAEVIKNGWYVTGDVAKIDEDGFIFITGRQSRISKIGGEMVPHILIEEAIEGIVRSNAIEQGSDDDESPFVAVTSLPDERKGEKIIVLHRRTPVTPDEICKRMLRDGLPPLWVPHIGDFMQVETIPLLGTGKLDLAEIQRIALARSVRNNGV